MAGFDKTDPRSAEAGPEVFPLRQHRERLHAFRPEPRLRHVRHDRPFRDRTETHRRPHLCRCSPPGIVMTLIGFAFKIAAAPFHLWAPDTYQGAPIPSAAFIASGSKVASFVVLGKIVLVGFGPAQGSAAWHAMIGGWAPVLAALAALSIVDRQPRRARAIQCPPPARLLRRRPRRLHSARARRRRSRGICRHPLLHHGLCLHPRRRVRRRRARPPRNRRRRFHPLFRALVALAACSRGA